MSVEFLSEPSKSGQYPEHRFEAVGDCAWVLFRPPNDDDWVGVFGRAKYGENACALHWPAERVFVIAAGRGYLVNTRTHRLMWSSRSDRLQDVIYVSSHGVFVAVDELRMHVFNHEGPEWATERISWGGLRNLKVAGSVVAAEAWVLGAEDTWSGVTLDLGTRSVCGATYHGPDDTSREVAT